jgi:hypothetical protein
MANKDKPTPQLELEKRALDLINYTYKLLPKFPKVERHGLCEVLKSGTHNIARLSSLIASYFERDNRETLLRELYAEIKTMIKFVHVAYVQGHISSKNLEAWVRKLNDINSIIVGWLTKIEQTKKAAKKKSEKTKREMPSERLFD